MMSGRDWVIAGTPTGHVLRCHAPKRSLERSRPSPARSRVKVWLYAGGLRCGHREHEQGVITTHPN